MNYPDLYQYEKNSGIGSNTADSDGIDLSESYNGYSSGLTQNTYTATTSRLLTVKDTNYKFAIDSNNIKNEAYSVIYNESYYWVASRSIDFSRYSTSNTSIDFQLIKCGAELNSDSPYIGYGINQTGFQNTIRPVITLKEKTKIEKCSGTNSKGNPHIIESY